MMTVQFVVPGQPQGKGRPRFRVVAPKGKESFVSTYTPAETVKYESKVSMYAKAAMRSTVPSDLPIEVRMEFHMQIPVSWSKKKQAAALAGTVRATKKPDFDNVLKGILDACNGVVFVDDAQIVEVSVRKLYSINPRVIVAMR